jgi:chromosome segregation ATPase
MRQLTMIMALLLLATMMSGCGLQNQINDLKNRQGTDEGAINDLQNRVKVLESQMSSATSQLVTLGTALGSQGANIQGQINSAVDQIRVIRDTGTANQTQLNQLSQSLALTQNDVSVLHGQVTAIQGVDINLTSDLTNLQSSLSNLAATVAALQSGQSVNSTAVTTLVNQISDSQINIMALTHNVSSLQSQINSSLVQIAVLQGYQNIVSIKDPCGAQGSYNEVFLKLSSGHYLASFSDNANGLNTRFTQLTDGTFQTTDGTSCNFTVSGNGTVISNEHN